MAKDVVIEGLIADIRLDFEADDVAMAMALTDAVTALT